MNIFICSTDERRAIQPDQDGFACFCLIARAL